MFKYAGALRASLVGAFIVFVFSSTAAFSAPPVEAFGNIGQVSMMKLSPDGRHIAAIQPINGRPQVVIYDFGDPAGVKTYAFTVNDAFADNVVWASNDRVVCLYEENTKIHYDTEMRTWARTFSITADAKNMVRLMNDSMTGAINTATTLVVDSPLDNPGYVYIAAYQLYSRGSVDTRIASSRDGVIFNVFKVDVNSGHADPAEHGDVDTAEWLMDGHGHGAARIDEHQKNLTDDLLLPSGGGWDIAATYPATGPGSIDFGGLTMDGGAIGLVQVGNQGTQILNRFDIASRKLGEVMFSDPQYDLDGVLRDQWTRRIVGVTYVDDKLEYRYFDPARASVQKKLEAAMPDQTVSIVSSSPSGDAYIVRTEGVRNPPVFYLFHTKTSQLETLLSAYPGLTPADLGTMKPYPYKSRDGLDIHAYLTLPPGKAPKNLPTVIFPHGGPRDRDEMGFNWWAQFMASRGYAVLQPNFRGSTGYGVAFRDAGNGQWGRTMQDDITDGVKKLIADGIADPKRICIVGASYGGYAASAGATFTPDLYQCAVSYAGVSDLPGLIGFDIHKSGQNKVTEAVLDTMIGSRFSDDAHLREVSPLFHVDQVKIPMLLLHCTNDLTVPIVQSQEEQGALEKAGKNVQFVSIDGDDHYLRLSKTRIQVLKALETFLAAHIGT